MKTPGMVACALIAIGVASFPSPTSSTFPTVGSIERVDPAVDAIVPAGAKIEKLADDCTWTEGPVWIHSGCCIRFREHTQRWCAHYASIATARTC